MTRPIPILRLEPPIPVETPKGKALAVIWRDYGHDQHDLWTCVVEATGEFWTFQNPDVKARQNPTFNIRGTASDDLAEWPPLRIGEKLRVKMPYRSFLSDSYPLTRPKKSRNRILHPKTGKPVE